MSRMIIIGTHIAIRRHPKFSFSEGDLNSSKRLTNVSARGLKNGGGSEGEKARKESNGAVRGKIRPVQKIPRSVSRRSEAAG